MATIVDSYSEANKDLESSLKDTHPSDSGEKSARGQSFTGDGQNIDSCKFYLKRVGTCADTKGIARLYAHTGTFGTSSLPTGVALASSDEIDIKDISAATIELVTFPNFAGTLILTNGTKYVIVFEASGGTWDADNHILTGIDNSSPTHGGNSFYHTGAGWDYSGADTCFYVYGVAAQTISPSAIASLEAFGNPTVLPGAVTIQPSAIASLEAFGSPTLKFTFNIFPTAIESAEAFGTPLVIPGAVIIQPSGIASQEAFGTPLLFYDQVIIPTGIASAEAFGTPTISFILLIKPKSIPSAEAFGTLKVLREIIHIILDGQYTLGSPGVNRIYIIGKDAEGNPVYGTSLNQAEIDLVGERLDFNQDLSIPTTAKAADVAAAAVAKARLTGSRGFIVIPPNCGQELWDVIQVTDKPTAQSQQKYRVIAVSFDYEPLRHRFHHKLILGAP